MILPCAFFSASFAMPLAIVSALPEEQQGLQLLLTHTTTERHAGRTFTRGMFHGQEVVLALSGIGKVAAATTTEVLMERFARQRLVFTGVAGGLAPHVRDILPDGFDDEGYRRFRATICYGDALFDAVFALTPDGLLEMVDDEPVAEGLPLRKERLEGLFLVLDEE